MGWQIIQRGRLAILLIGLGVLYEMLPQTLSEYGLTQGSARAQGIATELKKVPFQNSRNPRTMEHCWLSFTFEVSGTPVSSSIKARCDTLEAHLPGSTFTVIYEVGNPKNAKPADAIFSYTYLHAGSLIGIILTALGALLYLTHWGRREE